MTRGFGRWLDPSTHSILWLRSCRMGCREFFDANKRNSTKCKLLQAMPEEQQLCWETKTASEFSPGPVASTETLCREIVDPTHYDPATGKIKPTLFDDASSKGASVQRLPHTNIEAIEERTRLRVEMANENPPQTGRRTAIGFTTITAAEIRDILTDANRRSAAVYDTGNEGDSAHADICQLVSGRKEGSSVRARLFSIAKERLVRFTDPTSS